MLRAFLNTYGTTTGVAAEAIEGVLFVMGCLFAGVAIHFGSKKYHYAYTVGCFLFGVIAGLLEEFTSFSGSFNAVSEMNPTDLLMLFLPILIFESSFGMDPHMFYKALPQCLILAVVGYLFCTMLTAVFAKYALVMYDWSWLIALVFGSIVSATDPVAVVALLREMKMPHTFTVLIEGESLLNDGVAVVMYEMFVQQIESGKPFEASTTSIELAKTCFGAPLLGYFLGKMTEYILIRIYISPVSELSITFVMSYVTYFVAEEILGISAIVAVVLYGITLNANRMCISPESEAFIHTHWRLLAVYANTLIFMIVGVLVTGSFSNFIDLEDAYLILGTYLTLTVLRSLMIAIFFPCLRKTGYGLNWKESIILSWGALRGAIGLALSLMLASNPHVKESENAKKVLIQVSGIIVLTLVVNANTVKCLMKVIHFKEITLVDLLSMGNAMASVSEMKDKCLRTCKGEWKFMKANWEWVNERTKLEDPYKGGLRGDDPKMASLFVPPATCTDCLKTLLPHVPTTEEMEELKEAARKNVLTAFKGILWEQFREGLLQRRSLRVLCLAIDNMLDHRDKYLEAEDVKEKFMNVGKLNKWLEINLSHMIKKLKLKRDAEYELEMNHLKTTDFGGFRSFCLWIYFSRWCKLLLFVVIISHVAQIATGMYYAHSGAHEYDDTLANLTIFFIVFNILEIIVKISALKWNLYIKIFWNKVDFALSFLAVVDGFVDVFFIKYFSDHKLAIHVRILIIVRIFRYYYIVVNMFISFLSFIRSHASSELYYAYDIGRGFLFACEAILKNIDVIVDFGPCATTPVNVLEKNVQEMLDILDDFVRNYPSVVYALKTNRAARRILNKVKDALDRLHKTSLVLDEEEREMKSILFEMTKTVVKAPKYRPFIRDILKILQEVQWMKPDFSKDIYGNHVVVNYESGGIIQRKGEKHDFLFIIASGIVKVTGNGRDQENEARDQLPNVDSLLYFKTENTKLFSDYLTIAGTIGLLGYLQKSPSITSAVCLTDCELIQIEYSYLDAAKETFDDLIFCMWKSIGIKIGLQLLEKQYRDKVKETFDDLIFCMWKSIGIKIGLRLLEKQYRDKRFYEEEAHLRLERAILPDLRKVTFLEVPDIVEDIILIQGRTVDERTGMEFSVPSYIPRSSSHLKFLDDVNHRAPIIMMFLLEKKYWSHKFNQWVDPDNLDFEALSHFDYRMEKNYDFLK